MCWSLVLTAASSSLQRHSAGQRSRLSAQGQASHHTAAAAGYFAWPYWPNSGSGDSRGSTPRRLAPGALLGMAQRLDGLILHLNGQLQAGRQAGRQGAGQQGAIRELAQEAGCTGCESRGAGQPARQPARQPTLASSSSCCCCSSASWAMSRSICGSTGRRGWRAHSAKQPAGGSPRGSVHTADARPGCSRPIATCPAARGCDGQGHPTHLQRRQGGLCLHAGIVGRLQLLEARLAGRHLQARQGGRHGDDAAGTQ